MALRMEQVDPFAALRPRDFSVKLEPGLTANARINKKYWGHLTLRLVLFSLFRSSSNGLCF